MDLSSNDGYGWSYDGFSRDDESLTDAARTSERAYRPKHCTPSSNASQQESFTESAAPAKSRTRRSSFSSEYTGSTGNYSYIFEEERERAAAERRKRKRARHSSNSFRENSPYHYNSPFSFTSTDSAPETARDIPLVTPPQPVVTATSPTSTVSSGNTDIFCQDLLSSIKTPARRSVQGQIAVDNESIEDPFAPKRELAEGQIAEVEELDKEQGGEMSVFEVLRPSQQGAVDVADVDDISSPLQDNPTPLIPVQSSEPGRVPRIPSATLDNDFPFAAPSNPASGVTLASEPALAGGDTNDRGYVYGLNQPIERSPKRFFLFGKQRNKGAGGANKSVAPMPIANSNSNGSSDETPDSEASDDPHVEPPSPSEFETVPSSLPRPTSDSDHDSDSNQTDATKADEKPEDMGETTSDSDAETTTEADTKVAPNSEAEDEPAPNGDATLESETEAASEPKVKTTPEPSSEATSRLEAEAAPKAEVRATQSPDTPTSPKPQKNPSSPAQEQDAEETDTSDNIERPDIVDNNQESNQENSKPLPTNLIIGVVAVVVLVIVCALFVPKKPANTSTPEPTKEPTTEPLPQVSSDLEEEPENVSDLKAFITTLKYNKEDVSIPARNISVAARDGKVLVTHTLSEDEEFQPLDLVTESAKRSSALADALEGQYIASTTDQEGSKFVSITWVVRDSNKRAYLAITDEPGEKGKSDGLTLLSNSKSYSLSSSLYRGIGGENSAVEQSTKTPPVDLKGDAIKTDAIFEHPEDDAANAATNGANNPTAEATGAADANAVADPAANPAEPAPAANPDEAAPAANPDEAAPAANEGAN